MTLQRGGRRAGSAPGEHNGRVLGGDQDRKMTRADRVKMRLAMGLPVGKNRDALSSEKTVRSDRPPTPRRVVDVKDESVGARPDEREVAYAERDRRRKVAQERSIKRKEGRKDRERRRGDAVAARERQSQERRRREHEGHVDGAHAAAAAMREKDHRLGDEDYGLDEPRLGPTAQHGGPEVAGSALRAVAHIHGEDAANDIYYGRLNHAYNRHTDNKKGGRGTEPRIQNPPRPSEDHIEALERHKDFLWEDDGHKEKDLRFSGSRPMADFNVKEYTDRFLRLVSQVARTDDARVRGSHFSHREVKRYLKRMTDNGITIGPIERIFQQYDDPKKISQELSDLADNSDLNVAQRVNNRAVRRRKSSGLERNKAYYDKKGHQANQLRDEVRENDERNITNREGAIHRNVTSVSERQKVIERKGRKDSSQRRVRPRGKGRKDK